MKLTCITNQLKLNLALNHVINKNDQIAANSTKYIVKCYAITHWLVVVTRNRIDSFLLVPELLQHLNLLLMLLLRRLQAVHNLHLQLHYILYLLNWQESLQQWFMFISIATILNLGPVYVHPNQISCSNLTFKLF